MVKRKISFYTVCMMSVVGTLAFFHSSPASHAQNATEGLLLGGDRLNLRCEGQQLATERLSPTQIEATCIANPSPPEGGETNGSRICWPSVLPAAALASQPPPVFCMVEDRGAQSTAEVSVNRWVDDFDHGLSFANFSGTPYRIFEKADGIYDSIHWRHANHWMVDIAPDKPDSPFNSASGGAMIRPNQAFRFQDGTLIIESEFAAGHQDYSSLRAWGEMVVTTAPIPEGYRTGGVYAYEMFSGHHTLGCRLQADRHTICSLMDNTTNSAQYGGRTWEMSFFQHVGDTVIGGEPSGERGNYFRVCNAITDPDSACRDRFRMELTKTSLTIYVNGFLYFQQEGIPLLPDALLNGDVYVYFASISGRSEHDVIRFHWDRIAINP